MDTHTQAGLGDRQASGARRHAEWHWALMLVGLLCVMWLGTAQAASKNKSVYEYYLTGSADDVVVAPRKAPSVVLMGGGPDVDAAFAWMIEKGGGGNFVVIRVRGADGYNPYIYAMGGVSSVETLVIQSREAAADPFVLDRVSKAEMLFIAGGDQSDYIRLWQGTPLEQAVQELMGRNVPIGGTSAGLAVLGQFDFAALRGTVSSDQALADPYNKYMTLERDFLVAPGLAQTIADAHLDTRDRMGRLLTFVARTIQDGWTEPKAARGIGVDVETALLVDNGLGTRVGVGAVYFLSPTIAPTVCAPGQPLTFRNVIVQRLSGSGRFDLSTWRGSPGDLVIYDISAEVGVLISSQPGGSIY